MNKKIVLSIVTVLIITIMTSFWFLRSGTKAPVYSGPVETVRAGTFAEYSTLLRIAKEQGFFSNNGLDVTITEYPVGASAFKGMLDGEVDVAMAGDFVGVRNSFETHDFRILASTFKSPNALEMVARKDHGILSPADLKGKRIGLTKKTAGEFFLRTFLEWNAVPLDAVTLVDAQPLELVSMMSSGTVDAVVAFNPYPYSIAQTLGKNAIVFEVQNNKLAHVITYGRLSFVEEHQDTVRKFVQALVEADQFVSGNQDGMKAFFLKQFQYLDEYVADVLSQAHFTISLNQDMILQMENEARWMIAEKFTDKTVIPNYLDFIYFDALEKAKPEAIDIIH